SITEMWEFGKLLTREARSKRTYIERAVRRRSLRSLGDVRKGKGKIIKLDKLDKLDKLTSLRTHSFSFHTDPSKPSELRFPIISHRYWLFTMPLFKGSFPYAPDRPCLKSAR